MPGNPLNNSGGAHDHDDIEFSTFGGGMAGGVGGESPMAARGNRMPSKPKFSDEDVDDFKR